jgi:hypothetical protein
MTEGLFSICEGRTSNIKDIVPQHHDARTPSTVGGQQQQKHLQGHGGQQQHEQEQRRGCCNRRANNRRNIYSSMDASNSMDKGKSMHCLKTVFKFK